MPRIVGLGLRWCRWRWSAPLFARQSLVEWAGQSIKWCPWANAYYLQQKERKNRHSAILRSLAFKRLRILWRCWRDRKTYNDALYLAHLRDRKAPLLQFLPAARKMISFLSKTAWLQPQMREASG